MRFPSINRLTFLLPNEFNFDSVENGRDKLNADPAENLHGSHLNLVHRISFMSATVNRSQFPEKSEITKKWR